MGTYEWQAKEARKPHKCVRGCEIKPRDLYYSRDYDSSWNSGLKFCTACLAMILYYKGVSDISRGSKWLWNIQTEQSHREQKLNADGITRLLAKVREVEVNE